MHDVDPAVTMRQRHYSQYGLGIFWNARDVHDSGDMDGSRSDNTLPSLNTVLTSVKKSSRTLSPMGDLHKDADQSQLLETRARLLCQEAANGSNTLLPSTPATAQASSTVRDHTASSPDRIELDAHAGIPTHQPETVEVSRRQPTSFIESEAQYDGSESCGAFNNTTLSAQHAIGQTREDSHDMRHEVDNCTEVCVDYRTDPDFDSPNRLVGHNSPPLPSPLEICEEEGNNDKDKAINDNLTRPLAQQLRRKSTRRIHSRLEQRKASNCDSDTDDSSSSGSEDAVLEDEDYLPSQNAVGQEQACCHSVDEVGSKMEGSALGPPRKRRKMGRRPRGPRPYRRSSRLTSLTTIANPLGLHTPAHSPCSVSSQNSVTAANAAAPVAKYQEWPVSAPTFKSLIINGNETFQLEWSRKLCTGHHAPGSHNGSRSKHHMEKVSSRTQRISARYTFAQKEDDLSINLKEEKHLSWQKIHEQFSVKFPQRRSKASLQVRYTTKLKTSSKQATRHSNRG